MTLAMQARIILDPKAILEKKQAHDLAHAFVRARKAAEAKAKTRRRVIKSR